jgi:hypothetical protein
MAVRAQPVGVAAAAGEVPGAADAIAAGNGGGARGVGRPPGDDGRRIGEDGSRDSHVEKGRDQGGAVGNEDIPRNRRVMAGDLLDRQHIASRLGLLAARRAWQQQAE